MRSYVAGLSFADIVVRPCIAPLLIKSMALDITVVASEYNIKTLQYQSTVKEEPFLSKQASLITKYGIMLFTL